MKKLLSTFAVLTMLTACDMGQPDDDDALQAAVSWADAYFNCDYHEAADLTTPESYKWLSFAASNTTDQELEVLREGGGAQTSASDYFSAANDTLRIVKLFVSSYLAPVAIGETPYLEEEGVFQVTVVLRDNKWKVRMEGLPRNERQSPD